MNQIQATKELLQSLNALVKELDGVTRDVKSLRHLKGIAGIHELIGDKYIDIETFTDNAEHYEVPNFIEAHKKLQIEIRKVIERAQPVMFEVKCQRDSSSINGIQRDMNNGKEVDESVRAMMGVYQSFKWLNDLMQGEIEKEENSSFKSMIEKRIKEFVPDYYLVIDLLEGARGRGNSITKFEVIGAHQTFKEHKDSWDEYVELKIS